jgi:hypothetical protein
VRQFRQIRVKTIQNSRSRAWRCGRLVVRVIAVSCCRSARFSNTNSRCPRSANASARPITSSSSSMRRSCVGPGAEINADEFWQGPGVGAVGGAAPLCAGGRFLLPLSAELPNNRPRTAVLAALFEGGSA